MSKFKIDDRIVVYDLDFDRLIGIVREVNSRNNVKVKLDIGGPIQWYHPKQCRKLVKKKIADTGYYKE